MEQDPEDELHLKFLATEEMEQWAAFQDAAEMAIDQGVESIEVRTAFLALILPEIKSSPLEFEALREVWNRLCDTQGLPHLKRGLPPTTEDEAEDGPF